MSGLDFTDLFREITGHEPRDYQVRLAERLARGEDALADPDGVALPDTAGVPETDGVADAFGLPDAEPLTDPEGATVEGVGRALKFWKGSPVAVASAAASS